MMGKLLLLVLTVGFGLAAWKIASLFQDGEIPELEDGYWGPEDLKKELSKRVQVRPFKILVEDKVLKDLKTRLTLELETLERIPPPLEGVKFEYGFNSRYLEPVLKYWLNKYDWRKREALLNKYPQFMANIAGLDIHFQHVKSTGGKQYKKTYPLLMLHGWPGSFVEFQKIIPLLTNPVDSEYNFELVIPSLPGYGFSQGSLRPGLGPLQMGQIFLQLMKQLGHEKFYIQGGDWGSLIGTAMSQVFPDNVLGFHSNMCVSDHPMAHIRLLAATTLPSVFLTEEERTRFPELGNFWKFLIRESGYLHLQATKPDTVGVALSQSPAGLAAYILEKFATWTNAKYMNLDDGGLSKHFSLDELIDNLMVYWVTNSITTSMRLYAEALDPAYSRFGLESVPIKVPTACLLGQNDDYSTQSPSTLKDKHRNMVQFTFLHTGGHFMAMEQPELMAKDIFQFFSKLTKPVKQQS